MASVWCAEDLVLGRTVAIKVLARRFAHDEVAVRRFKREARAAARVSNHAHVVTIYDVGDAAPGDSDPDGPSQAFIVMEHLTGGTVADSLRIGAVHRREALRWLSEAASALDHAHARGVVHRDIKPANFLLDGNRILHVADFGIARLASEDTITSAGELFGTAAYLSPEQALGRDATGASDRYALAVAAFELLAGERPFTAEHFAAQARQHIDDPPPSAAERNRDLPASVDPVLARGMAKDPNARYETAGALVLALDDALSAPVTAPTRATGLTTAHSRTARSRQASSGAGTAATAVSAITPFKPRRQGHGRTFALAALLVAAIAIAAVAVAGLGGSSRPASSKVGAGPATAATHRAAKPKHSASAASSSTASASSSTTTAQASATAPSPPATPTSPASVAEQLQLTGHQDLVNGNYQQAISTLRQALSAASPGSLTYAYALYDLGRSLTLSGDPAAAIPILQHRLSIPNQTSTVQHALKQAEQAAGQASSPSSTPTPASPPAPHKSTPSAAPISGGAGLPSPGHGRGHGHDHG